MSNNVKGVTRSRRCPICNHEDWCGFMPTMDGELVICKRETTASKRDILPGADGRYYTCVGISRGGNRCFMDSVDVQRAMDLAGTKDFTPRAMPEPEYIDPVEQLSDAALDKVYRAMLKHLQLEALHRAYLHKEGWTDKMIEKYQIVSFPEKDYSRFKFRKNVKLLNPYRKRLAKEVLEELGNPARGLRGVPGAFQQGDDWTFCGPSGILFPQYNGTHQIVGLRIRMDYCDINAALARDTLGEYFIEKDEKYYLQPMKGAYQLLNDGSKVFRKDGVFKGKYRNFSSFHADEEEEKNNRIVNIYKNGCAAGNKLSFYCDEHLDDMFIAYITEGEKKGAFANHKMQAPFISLPGVDSWKLLLKGKRGERPVDVLKEHGCQIIVVAFDADKVTNATVLAREQQTVEGLKEEGFLLGLASWDISLGKGIDDLLAAGFMPSYEVVNN